MDDNTFDATQTPVTDEQMASVLATAPIKRKRGRPRKNPTPTPVVNSEATVGAPVQSGGVSTGDSGQPVRKKRARKVKSDAGDGRMTGREVPYDITVDLPPETPNFTVIYHDGMIRNVMSKAGIRVPNDSSLFLWTYKDKFVVGISKMGQTEKNGDVSFHYDYNWHIVDRNTWQIVESYEGHKEKIFEKTAKYDGKNIVCANHIQLLVEEKY